MTDAPTITDAPDGVEDLPPSAKLVWIYVRLHGPATQKAIVEGTTLSAKTVREALNRLAAAGAVTSRPRLRDVRQDHYRACDSTE